MIVGPSSAGSEWFLNGIAQTRQRETTTQQQISSGYRVSDASDAPFDASRLVNLVDRLSSAETYQSNLDRVKTEVDTGEQALAASVSLMENARTIATQQGGSTATPEGRLAAAAQIDGIQQQLVSIANTTVEGRYIFGGDNDQNPTYQIDATSTTGVDQLTAQTATRVIDDINGQPLFAAQTAQNIFDHRDSLGAPAPDNVFAALQALKTALLANDTPGIAASVDLVRQTSDYLNQQQATYGVAQQRLQSAQDDVETRITSIRTQISGIRDTDIVQASVDLNQEKLAESAAMAAQANMPQKSLFDYLG